MGSNIEESSNFRNPCAKLLKGNGRMKKVYGAETSRGISGKFWTGSSLSFLFHETGKTFFSPFESWLSVQYWPEDYISVSAFFSYQSQSFTYGIYSILQHRQNDSKRSTKNAVQSLRNLQGGKLDCVVSLLLLFHA